jgi:alpha-galactosidase
LTRFTRRSFFGAATAAAVTAAVGESHASTPSAATHSASTYCDILCVPDHAIAFGEDLHAIPLQRSQSAWQASGIEVRTVPAAAELNIFVTAPAHPLIRVHLRWNVAVDRSVLILGDAWERSYGDLAWRTFVPERAMPWYFATQARDGVHGYGVRTAAGSLCFWQVDREGISLWLDVSNGGMGVTLGQRELHAATVVSRKGSVDEAPLGSVRNFCRVLCPKPRLHKGPVFGSNDWYYAYGKNKGEWILRDAEFITELSPATGPRPFVVIDDGWEGNSSFPDMAQMADEIRKRSARPGIWVRPLIAKKSADANLLLSASRFGPRTSRAQDLAYDPTIPEALNAAMKKISDPTGWKYELIKHDYSTYDLLGQWGPEMGPQPTISGWHFSDRSKTNAEIILNLYTAIRNTAGDAPLILGCNAVGHLSAGLFELQRTGDDTSGQVWERTRRMGVNTLAFRLPQHNTFFALDADCVGITRDIPWERNRDWLDLIARSGTALFVSPAPEAIGYEQKAAIREAFAIASSGASSGHPLDWLSDTAPQDWEFKSGAASPTSKHYNWDGEEGSSPYPIS